MRFKVICVIFLSIYVVCGQTPGEKSCGKRSTGLETVLGEEKAKPNAWPWLVAFIYWPENQFFCSGSLVSERHVISGAHCFKNKDKPETPPHYVTALIGKHNLSDVNEPGSTKHSVWQIILHPDWNSEAVRFDADISVVVLRDHVTFSGTVQPICLPQSSDEIVGNGTVVGWGKSERSESINEHFNPTPSELEVPAVNDSTCFEAFPDIVHVASERTFCADYENKENLACSGDSGGGFYRHNPSKRGFELKGIVSASLRDPANPQRSCNINAFSIFTDVAKLVNWIGNEMKETKEIAWKEVEFNCTLTPTSWISFWPKCSHNHPGPLTRNLKIRPNFSNHTETKNAADLDNLMLNFTPSTHIFAGIGEHFTNLKKLWVIDQLIKFIVKEDFADMTQLEGLFFTNNQIEFLPENVFSNLPNLEELDLRINRIAKLGETLFTNLRKLNYIVFDSNKIEFLPEDIFFNLESLETLSLSDNKIKKLPEKITNNLRKLKTVYFSSNKIKHFPKDLFVDNLELEEIHANKNPLKTIDVDFTKLPKLKFLRLKNSNCIDFWAWDKAEVLEAQQIINRSCTSQNPQTFNLVISRISETFPFNFLNNLQTSLP